MNTYNGIIQTKLKHELDEVFEELNLVGYSIITNFFDFKTVSILKEAAIEVYDKQENEFGASNLEKIQDKDIARNLVAYHHSFLEVAKDLRLNEIVKKMLNPNFVLSLSNVIINRANSENHQSKWHRDFPYQNFIADEMLGFNALIALTDFTEENGSTILLPHSNKFKNLPSDSYINKHMKKAICPAGSVILFDSMLFHRAGKNQSDEDRFALNLNFVRPFIKQQYLNTHLDDSIFGKKYFSSDNDKDFRTRRL